MDIMIQLHAFLANAILYSWNDKIIAIGYLCDLDFLFWLMIKKLFHSDLKLFYFDRTNIIKRRL